MQLSPKRLKGILRFYGPYLGAGIRVTNIRDDWHYLRVEMKLHWYNRNAAGTHFGGSLYAMVDPHYMLMLMQILGKEYIIWDKSAGIEFVNAVKGKVHAEFQISEEMVTDIKKNTSAGEKYLPEFKVDIVDENENVVARVQKVIYIRKKKK